MDQTIRLYQFVRAGNPILLARVTQVGVRQGPGPGEETVEVGIEVLEALWREAGAPRRTVEFRRPASPTAQLKFPDPVWGRAKLQQGAMLLVVMSATGPAKGAHPIRVDPVAEADPVLAAVRSVLDVERTVKGRAALFQKRLLQLRGSTVEKLFAGEALAAVPGPFSVDEQAQLDAAFPRAFADEKDDYVKLSLGAWLWDGVYRRLGNAGRVNTLNATLQAAASPTEVVRTFALDRLAVADPKRLREPSIRPAPEVIRQLEARRESEQDGGTRRHLEEVIAALRR